MPARITTKRLTRGPRKGQVVSVYASNGNEVRSNQGHTRNRHRILRRARPSVVRVGKNQPTRAARKIRQMKSRRVKRLRFGGPRGHRRRRKR